jgi:hypothetical protein
VLVVPCVGFVLAFTSVVKSKSFQRFTNVGRIRGFGAKDYQKSSMLIVLFGFMAWLN